MSKNNDLTNKLAMDCEMVGAAGKGGQVNMVGRVSLVNEDGDCVYDVYVKPTKPVIDYRTPVSGITARLLTHGRDFNLVKADVASIIKGRILVGHAVDKDLQVLGLCHPEWNVRDTSIYPPFRTRRGTPSLKYLASRYLGWSIQNGAHSSVQDAKAAMMVYQHVEEEWEYMLYGTSSESEEEEEYQKYYSSSSDD